MSYAPRRGIEIVNLNLYKKDVRAPFICESFFYHGKHRSSPATIGLRAECHKLFAEPDAGDYKKNLYSRNCEKAFMPAG
jgi:hypothetical protein